jgi:hypothetical protein
VPESYRLVPDSLSDGSLGDLAVWAIWQFRRFSFGGLSRVLLRKKQASTHRNTFRSLVFSLFEQEGKKQAVAGDLVE